MGFMAVVRGKEQMQNKVQSGINGVQHIGIPTNDLEQTQVFFQALGFSCTYCAVIGAGKHVRFFKRDDVMIEAFETDNPLKTGVNIDHIALDVSNIEDAYREAIEQGYRPLEGEICFLPFFENGVRFFTLVGPNNEKIELNQKL
jgi:catechol 2,3-dioxygenase-like lactoylglutathione lyase family enzyme